jgi:cytoskeletal protein RodZ
LKQARERRGLSLQEIARETKIPRRHLEALEQGHVPGASEQFYRRAELRAYARAVHADERLAVGLFEKALEAAPREAAPAAQARRPSPPFIRRRLAVAAAVALAAFLVGTAVGVPWVTTGNRTQENTTPVGAAEPPSRRPVARLPAGPEAIPASHRSESDGRQRPAVPLAHAASAGPAGAGAPPAPEAAGVPSAPDTIRAAPPAPVTELVVTTEPAGARVTVNGVGWGLSPVTVRHLTPGAKRIRITKDGFAAEERTVPLAEGSVKALDVRLTAQ